MKELQQLASELKMPVDLVQDKTKVASWRHAITNYEVIKNNIYSSHQLKIYRGSDNHTKWGPYLTWIINQIEYFVDDHHHKNELIYINLKCNGQKEEYSAVDLFRRQFKKCMFGSQNHENEVFSQ